MSFFSRLLGRFKTPEKGIVGKNSMLAMMLETGMKFDPRTCSICKSTVMIPASEAQFFDLPPGYFTVDVGGYCYECKAHRCGVHTVMFEFPSALWNSIGKGEAGLKRLEDALKKEKLEMVTVLGCRKCKTPYKLASKEITDLLLAEAKRIKLERGS